MEGSYMVTGNPWQTVWLFHKRVNIPLLDDPETPLLHVVPKENKTLRLHENLYLNICSVCSDNHQQVGQLNVLQLEKR